MKLFDIINKPLGVILRFIAGAFQDNFAASVFVFTLLINLLFIPLTIKSQKSTVQQLRIKPKLDALKKKYGDDKQKYSQAMSQLYQEEKVSMSGGCLPMIFRLIIMMSIYTLIMSPITYMTGVEKTKITNVTSTVSSSLSQMEKNDKDKYAEVSKKFKWDHKRQNELDLVNLIRTENPEATIESSLPKKEYKKIETDFKEIVKKDNEKPINYEFFGINLTETPSFSLDIFNKWDKTWIMPLLAFAAQMLSSIFSMKLQKKNNPDAPSMTGMMLTMPLISLFIGFKLPGGVTFYWACSSLIGGFIQIAVQQFYGPHKLLAKERSKELTVQCDFEAGQIKKLGNKE